MNIRQKGTLGRDESLPGVPFIRLMNPTDFDNVREAMRITIKEKLNWDFINPLAWKTIGLAGGPIDKFLIDYKSIAIQRKEGYNPLNKKQWENIFIQGYGYDEESISLLLDTFWELYTANKIPQSIYQPWTYIPEDNGTFYKYLKTALKYTTIGAVAYFSILAAPKIFKGFVKK